MTNLAPKQVKTFEVPETIDKIRLENRINGSITLIAAVEQGVLDIIIESVQLVSGGATPASPTRKIISEG